VLELFDLEGATARLVDDGGRALGPDEACERRAADGAGVPGVAEASCTTDGLDPGDGGVIDLGADLDVTGPLGALLVDVEGLTTTGEAFTVTSLSGGGGGPASPL
jgi:hypothetical protein